MMPPVRTIGIVFFILAAGCAGLKAPPGAMAQRGPLMVDPSLLGSSQIAAEPLRGEAREQVTSVELAPPPVVPLRPEVKEQVTSVELAPLRSEPRQPLITADAAIASEPVAAAAAPPEPSKRPSAAQLPPPPAKAPAKPSTAAVAIERPRKNDDPPAVARPAEPPLDMEALKARLRDTNAIGVFTKLALKNQVDDLLKQFRAHYLNGQKTSVAALRQAYDMLVLKVLALIQDSDPSLARTISGSREAIWGILADPEKFKSAS